MYAPGEAAYQSDNAEKLQYVCVVCSGWLTHQPLSYSQDGNTRPRLRAQLQASHCQKPAFAPRSCVPSTVGEEGCDEPGLECRSMRACEGRTDTGSGVAALPPATLAAGGRSPGAPRRAGACGPAACAGGGGVCMGDSGGRPPPCAPAGAPAVRSGDGGVRAGDGGVSSCTAAGRSLQGQAPQLGRLADFCSRMPAALRCKPSPAALRREAPAALRICQQLCETRNKLSSAQTALLAPCRM